MVSQRQSKESAEDDAAKGKEKCSDEAEKLESPAAGRKGSKAKESRASTKDTDKLRQDTDSQAGSGTLEKRSSNAARGHGKVKCVHHGVQQSNGQNVQPCVSLQCTAAEMLKMRVRFETLGPQVQQAHAQDLAQRAVAARELSDATEAMYVLSLGIAWLQAPIRACACDSTEMSSSATASQTWVRQAVADALEHLSEHAHTCDEHTTQEKRLLYDILSSIAKAGDIPLHEASGRPDWVRIGFQLRVQEQSAQEDADAAAAKQTDAQEANIGAASKPKQAGPRDRPAPKVPLRTKTTLTSIALKTALKLNSAGPLKMRKKRRMPSDHNGASAEKKAAKVSDGADDSKNSACVEESAKGAVQRKPHRSKASLAPAGGTQKSRPLGEDPQRAGRAIPAKKILLKRLALPKQQPKAQPREQLGQASEATDVPEKKRSREDDEKKRSRREEQKKGSGEEEEKKSRRREEEEKKRSREGVEKKRSREDADGDATPDIDAELHAVEAASESSQPQRKRRRTCGVPHVQWRENLPRCWAVVYHKEGKKVTRTFPILEGIRDGLAEEEAIAAALKAAKACRAELAEQGLLPKVAQEQDNLD